VWIEGVLKPCHPSSFLFLVFLGIKEVEPSKRKIIIIIFKKNYMYIYIYITKEVKIEKVKLLKKT
jgi:hypothetical protein